MRTLALILGFGGLALAAAAVGLAMWAHVEGDPLSVIGMLLADADPIGKVALFLILAGFAVIAVSGGLALARPGGRPQDALMVLGWAAPGLGLLAALYGALNIRTAMARTGTTHLMVIAPSVSEVMLIAAIGLMVGGVGLGVNATLARRA